MRRSLARATGKKLAGLPRSVMAAATSSAAGQLISTAAGQSTAAAVTPADRLGRNQRSIMVEQNSTCRFEGALVVDEQAGVQAAGGRRRKWRRVPPAVGCFSYQKSFC